MSLKDKLEARGMQRFQVEKAREHVEQVLAQVVNNASKNRTGAQAMRGNISDLAADLKVLDALMEDYEAEDAAAAAEAEKLAKAAAKSKTPAAKAEKPTEVTEANETSEAAKA